ncbi:MAG: hypothetical protein JO130_02740 [Solirubrobacterales bacterium]|nr:hypothetical protein [Solirubrobacterales bacterium]
MIRNLVQSLSMPKLAVVVGIFTLAAAGGAYAASSGAGTITACAREHSGVLYQASRCAAHDRRLTWNVAGTPGAQGPQGPQGPQGLPGAQGVPGTPGSGYHFITASGTTGPTLTNAGTYLIDVTLGVENLTPSAVVDRCAIEEPSNPPGGGSTLLFVGGDFSLPADASSDFSQTGVVQISSNAVPTALSAQCTDMNGTPVPVDAATWWVSPTN